MSFLLPSLFLKVLKKIKIYLLFSLRDYHSLWSLFHISSAKNTNLKLLRFYSPLLTQSRLVSFPSTNKMFQFVEFVINNGVSTKGNGFVWRPTLKVNPYSKPFSLTCALPMQYYPSTSCIADFFFNIDKRTLIVNNRLIVIPFF